MKRYALLSLIALAAAAPSRALAQSMPMAAGPPKLSPVPTAAERPFIAKIQRDIPARFASVAAARKAGYFRYTGEDNTGAISYVNLKVWNSVNPEEPNQLWYDVNGRLLGVDYTVLMARSPKPPASLFGYAIQPARWVRRGPHIHYGFRLHDGKMKFGGIPVRKLIAAGGVARENEPGLAANKAALVKVGLPGLTAPDQVTFVFLHPAMWDLIAWVLPNPNGAWADANPNVIPSSRKKTAM